VVLRGHGAFEALSFSKETFLGIGGRCPTLIFIVSTDITTYMFLLLV
jgi:hypothetical protein